MLKQEVASLEQDLHSPRSLAFSVRRPNNPSLPQDNQLKNVSVNLQDLRQLSELTKAAKEQLEQVGLDDSSDSDSEYDSKKNNSKGRRSGIRAKNSDQVKTPQFGRMQACNLNSALSLHAF